MQINLTTPDQSKPGASAYKVAAFVINPEKAFIMIELVSLDSAYRRSFQVNNAAALIGSLNTANHSVKSLEQSILEYCIANFPETAGTIA